MASRPFLITLIAILAILIGLVTLAGGALLAFADIVPEGSTLALSAVHTLGYVTLAIGLLTLIVGIALWKGWTIAWYLGLILFGINAVMGIINIVINKSYSPVLSVVIAVIVIYYLFRPHVKEFFKV